MAMEFPQETSPAVSVIVPVYNAGQFIAECVGSVTGQSFTNWELILVDDGSTDSSGDMCDTFAISDRRIRAIHTSNRGLSAARNTGIDHARGNWIFFLDADDTIPPDSLNNLYHTAGNEPECDIICGRFTHTTFYTSDDTVEVLRPEDAMIRCLYQRLPPDNSSCGKLYSASLFNTGIRFRINSYYEDLDIFPHLLMRSRAVAVTGYCTYFYRDNPNSFINRWSDARLDVLDVTDRIETYTTNLGRAALRSAQSRKFSANFNILLLLYKNGIDRQDVEKRCITNIRRLRGQMIRDRHVRPKNKFGAIVSYGGRPIIKMLSKSIFFHRK